jgi:hypothetical protein
MIPEPNDSTMHPVTALCKYQSQIRFYFNFAFFQRCLWFYFLCSVFIQFQTKNKKLSFILKNTIFIHKKGPTILICLKIGLKRPLCSVWGSLMAKFKKQHPMRDLIQTRVACSHSRSFRKQYKHSHRFTHAPSVTHVVPAKPLGSYPSIPWEEVSIYSSEFR